MHLYALTLAKPTACNAAVFGNFSAPKAQEFVVSRGHVLELLRPGEDGRLHTVASTEVYGLIRSLAAFKIQATGNDLLLVGSDSGRAVALEWDASSSSFKPAFSEPFGKTGCRRITPGQYVAADPAGRAFMVAATEKQKLVYTVSRADGKPVVSSPQEAHRSQALVFSLAALDAGLDNPLFAALEVEYGAADAPGAGVDVPEALPKSIVHYGFDLGLNSVTRKWARETDRGANMVLPVPGGASGPGGALVLAENWVLYESPSCPALRTPIPRRADMPDDRGLLLVAGTLHRQKAGVFWFLLQSELGDLYKATLAYDATSGVVSDLTVQYLDTLPPAVALAISRSGLLLVAAEAGNHALYAFNHVGEAETDVVATAHAVKIDESAVGAGGDVEVVCPVFSPRPLSALAKVDELPSLAPLVDMKVQAPVTGAGGAAVAALGGSDVAGAHGGAAKLLTACGRGPRGTLRVLREGLAVNEVAVAPVPGVPMSVLTVKAPETSAASSSATSSPPDQYMLVSFTNATLCLEVGDSIEQVPASTTGFLDSAPTLAAGRLADDTLVQVHPGGVRLIRGGGASGAPRRVVEWRAPGRREVTHAACNSRQVVLALSGGDLHYFELVEGASLQEKGGKAGLGADVTALALPPVPAGRLRAPLMALADSSNTVRVLSLDPAAAAGPLTQVSAQATRAAVTSLALVPNFGAPVAAATGAPAAVGKSLLFIGLTTGVLVRVAVDPLSGSLSDPRSRFLGRRGVRLAVVAVGGAGASVAVLALSSSPWLAHASSSGGVTTAPLSYEALEAGAGLATEAIPDGIVAVSGRTLRVLTVDKLGDTFNQRSLPLRFTPRRVAPLPDGRHAVVIEADHGAYCTDARVAAAGGAAADGDAASSAARGAGVADADGDVSMAGGAASSSAGGSFAVPWAPDSIPSCSHWAAAPGEAAGVADPLAEGVDVRRVGVAVPPAAAAGAAWGSAIRVVDTDALLAAEAAAPAGAVASLSHPATTHYFELPQDVAALSVAVCTFHDRPATDTYVVVGVARRLSFHPRTHEAAALLTFKLVDAPAPAAEGGAAASSSPGLTKQLQFLHATPVEELPYALAAFQGRLLAGVGKTLRLFDLGKKKLLRKAEARGFPSLITSLAPVGDRIWVGDASESVLAAKYRRGDNSLHIFADDTLARHVTCLAALDADTVAGGDKFGNLFVLRVPSDVSDDVDTPVGEARLWWDAAGGGSAGGPALGGCPNKLELVAQYYVGSVVTSLQRGVLGGGHETLLYSTITGAIGALLPLANREDADFFTHLELFMRGGGAGGGASDGAAAGVAASLLGRDHLAYRSYFLPVKDVVDGDLCEAFAGGLLQGEQQKALAADLDRSVADVLRKLEDARNKVL